MIKPLHTTQLSAAKPRTGLQSIGELLPRLMRHYEIQAEMVRLRTEELENRRNEESRATIARRNQGECNTQQAQVAVVTTKSSETQQATFAFYQ